MGNVEERVKLEILEGLHDYVGGDFAFMHDDINNILNVTEYTEEGEPLRQLRVSIGVEVVEAT